MVENADARPDVAREIAREVLVHGPVERSELGRRLNLSPASLTRLCKPYFDAGLFIERQEVQRATVGRRPRPIDVRVEARTFVGIKLTGDDAIGVLTDLRANVLRTEQMPLRGLSLAGVVDQLEVLVKTLTQGARVDGVGISLGGRVRDRRVVTQAVFLGWEDVALADALESVLGVPVRVENDVVALMAAEHWFGPARALDSFALVTIGAGVGYALVIRGEIVTSPDVGLAPMGHAPLEPNGPLCERGHRGCATAVLTIPGMCAQVASVRGAPVTFEEILHDARHGDVVSTSVVQASARALGRLVAWIANATTVTTVVLSGEGNGLFGAAEQTVRDACADDRQPESHPVQFIVEEPDFIMWARGAAAVAIQDVVVG
ncbi:ROK family transcriptional regulator [Cellulomonas soli]|uniref:ROK family transcriptional regulator n=1 Tax=Cellulomonas soli TaxID=931535 RepID=UPI0017B3B69C|nr:ROK family transcriptional regulator [Cellulomonas soli]NYI60063.1 putative NBD/HSP70 family sugar kinase [Cellulomonas soli]